MTVYVASKTRHAPMWRKLRESGLNIISTWIDEAGPGETKDKADLALRCLDEAARADWVIVYADEGDILKGAYIELGAALQAGHATILAVGPVISEKSTFRAHPRWLDRQSLEHAIMTITE